MSTIADRLRNREEQLEEAYREDARESEDFNREWEGVDAGVDE